MCSVSVIGAHPLENVCFIERSPPRLIIRRRWLCWLTQTISNKQTDSYIYENKVRLKTPINSINIMINLPKDYLCIITICTTRSITKENILPTLLWRFSLARENVRGKFSVLAIPNVMPANFPWSRLIFLDYPDVEHSLTALVASAGQVRPRHSMGVFVLKDISVATGEGASGATCPPPPPPIGHPLRSIQIRGDFGSRKMGVGLEL